MDDDDDVDDDVDDDDDDDVDDDDDDERGAVSLRHGAGARGSGASARCAQVQRAGFFFFLQIFMF